MKEAKGEMADSNLTAAARYLDEHGWCKYSLSDVEGRVCVMGALFHSFQESHDSLDYDYMSSLNKLVDYALWKYDRGPGYVNDAILQSKADAVEMLLAAAKWVEHE